MTQRFIVIRHGHSPAPAQVRDFDRPLSETGVAQVVRSAAGMREADLTPTHIIASPARRAWRSAEVLAGELGIEVASIVAEPRFYEASVATLAQLCSAGAAEANFPIFVGHNPGMSALVQHFVGRDQAHPIGLSTADWVCLGFDGPLAEGTATLVARAN